MLITVVGTQWWYHCTWWNKKSHNDNNNYTLQWKLHCTHHDNNIVQNTTTEAISWTTINKVTLYERAGIAHRLECQTCNWKGVGSSPSRSSRNFFPQGQLSVLTLILVSIPPLCYRSSMYISQSFYQKCRWQITAKHAYMKGCGIAWNDMVHGCMVYTERAEMAAVSCGTSHASAVSTPLRWRI